MEMIQNNTQHPLQPSEAVAQERAFAIKLLRVVPVFQPFTDDELWDLYSRGSRVKVALGNHLMIEGEPTRGIYLLVKGFVSVFRKLSNEQIRLATLHEGAFLGEISLFDAAPRSATIQAENDCDFFSLDEPIFQKFLNDGGPERSVRFYKKCAEFMAQRFRVQNDDFLSAQSKLWEQVMDHPKTP